MNLKKYNVKDFKPFENSKFTNLKDIFHANTILSLEGIEKVEKLEFLNLENSKIRYAKFYKTILVKTNLQNSDGYKTNFCGQDFTHKILSGVNFSLFCNLSNSISFKSLTLLTDN